MWASMPVPRLESAATEQHERGWEACEPCGSTRLVTLRAIHRLIEHVGLTVKHGRRVCDSVVWCVAREIVDRVWV